MKTLYIECTMGAAGDMLTAALLELVPDKAAALKKLNDMEIPGVVFEAEPSVKCGITGTHMRVLIHGEEEGATACGHSHDHAHDHECEHSHIHAHDHDHEHDHIHARDHDHEHHSMADIRSLIDGLAVSEAVKQKALSVYRTIAEAESAVHGTTVEQIHFHEVGTMDAVADVTAVCMLMEMLAPERVIVSPIHVGSGTVVCAHGRLPVPAPATALILTGIPIYSDSVQGELCTPTGAALLKVFADSFGPMPPMTVDKTGYGMGTKDFAQANCVRVMLGESFEMNSAAAAQEGRITEISCNLDDMTGEDLAFAAEKLLEAGALDVFTAPIYMKKGRPAVKLTVLARPEDEERLAGEIFRHTSTIGVRMHTDRRYELMRRSEQRETVLGTATVKISEGFGVHREKIEFASLKQFAEASGRSLAEVRTILAGERDREK